VKLPGIAELRELHLPRGRGAFFGGLAPLLRWRPAGPLRYLAPWSIFRARFGCDSFAHRCSRGHQHAVRPAIVARRRRVPQRGQTAAPSSRTRVSQRVPWGTRP
jgi:hypothetical protein